MTTLMLVRICAAVIAAALIVPAVPDVDLWGHTMFGGDIVRSAAIPASDHYAFTSDRPWVNHEWLSEVLMYGAYAAAGGNGLGMLRILLISTLLWIVWRKLTAEGVPAGTVLVILTVVALLTYPRTQHVRPQLFSIVIFAALLAELDSQRRTKPSVRLMLVPCLMLLWANLHGGFIVGLLPIGLRAAATGVESGWTSKSFVRAAFVAAAAAAATLVNPYGFALWQFLSSTVGLGRADITEWSAMPSAGVGLILMWVVTLAMAAAGLAQQPKSPSRLYRTALVGAIALASFRVSRLDAFFVVATAMSFGAPLGRLLAGSGSRERRYVKPQIATAALVLCALVAGATLLRAAPARTGCAENPDWLPDRDAAVFVARRALQGRMIVFFDWGEYVLWNFAPRLLVSIDGRRETVYSDRHVQGHLELYHGTDAGLAYARDLQADYAWLPNASPAVSRLVEDGWFALYSGNRSTILSRRSAPEPAQTLSQVAGCLSAWPVRSSPLRSGLWRLD